MNMNFIHAAREFFAKKPVEEEIPHYFTIDLIDANRFLEVEKTALDKFNDVINARIHEAQKSSEAFRSEFRKTLPVLFAKKYIVRNSGEFFLKSGPESDFACRLHHGCEDTARCLTSFLHFEIGDKLDAYIAKFDIRPAASAPTAKPKNLVPA